MDDIKDPVFTNIDTVDKEVKSRKMWLRKPTHLLYPQKIILTLNTKQINHKHPKKQSIPPKNKPDTINSIYKSRSTPRTNLSNKNIRIGKPSKIDIHRYNENVSLFSGQVDDLASVTPDNISIPCKNKRKKTPDTSFIRKEPIVYTFNPRKRVKEDAVTDVEKDILLKKHPYFLHKVYYEGDTDENNRFSDDLPTETDYFVINLDK